MRLVNVAVTRARGKFVLIAHKDWIRQNDAAKMGILWNILFGTATRPQSCAVLPPNIEVRADHPDISGAESPIEAALVAELAKLQHEIPPFVLQHRIFNEHGRIVSRADIAFVPEQIAVFCDGAEYHLLQSQWQRDLRQRRELSRLGWTVLAFTGREINSNAAACADNILQVIRARQSPGH
jgi:very-short-patch-repair endonuclease